MQWLICTYFQMNNMYNACTHKLVWNIADVERNWKETSKKQGMLTETIMCSHKERLLLLILLASGTDNIVFYLKHSFLLKFEISNLPIKNARRTQIFIHCFIIFLKQLCAAETFILFWVYHVLNHNVFGDVSRDASPIIRPEVSLETSLKTLWFKTW